MSPSPGANSRNSFATKTPMFPKYVQFRTLNVPRCLSIGKCGPKMEGIVQVSLVSVSLASSLLVFPGWRGGTLIMLTVSLVWP
jgi:hypothetical protein